MEDLRIRIQKSCLFFLMYKFRFRLFLKLVIFLINFLINLLTDEIPRNNLIISRELFST